MDFYFIPPNNYLELMDYGDRYFCLAQHYIKNKEYRNFFKQKVKEGKWVTLDNGAGDFETVTRESVLNIAEDLCPSELIPLDILFDKEQTLINLNWTIEQMSQSSKLCNIEVLVVPQGNSQEEWVDCYKQMIQDSRVSTVGFSKITIPWCFMQSKDDENIMEARHLCFDYLEGNDLLHKPIHLLGAGDPREFKYYNNHPMIRSNDTCNWIWSGINAINFCNNNFQRIKTPKDYFDRQLNDYQLNNAIDNIKWIKNNYGKID